MVYELSSKIGDAIPYCAKAISHCKSRIQNLKSSKDTLLTGKDDEASAAEAEGGSEKSAAETEIEQLTSILTDLEKKVNSYKCNLFCFMSLVLYQ